MSSVSTQLVPTMWYARIMHEILCLIVCSYVACTMAVTGISVNFRQDASAACRWWVWTEVCHATRQPHKSCHRLVRLARLGLSSVSGGGQYLVFELRILCVSATCSSHSARPPRRQAGNSATILWPREGDNVARASATEALMTSAHPSLGWDASTKIKIIV